MASYSFDTYAQLFKYITETYDNPTFLNYFKDGKYESISTQQFKERVSYLALALEDIGLQEYDSVGIFCKPSPEWIIFDFALQLVKGVSVPLFEDISQKNLDFELHDSQIKFIFTDHTHYQYELSDDITIIGCNIVAKNKKFVTLDELYVRGEMLYRTKAFRIEECIQDIKPNFLFSVVYTSGNTGVPKGVELTQRNVISQLHAIHRLYKIKPESRALSFLPLAHIFERTVMTYYLSCGISIYFVDDVHNVAPLMREVKPTIMTVVPRLLEKVFLKIEEKVNEKEGFEGFIAKMAFNRALYKKNNTPNLIDKVLSHFVYSKFLESFGGEIEIMVTGGANLDKDIYNFFVNIGLPLYQGYGQTESSPVIAVNYPENNKVGTCGKALPGVEVKLSEDNELLAKGANIMRGYRNNPALTNITIEDGWLYTGDLASIDEEGYITIHSRKKELMKTSTGKYISAIHIEQAINKSKYIDYSTVIANERKYATALLFINPDLAEENSMKTDEYYKKPEIKSAIIEHIKKVNKDLDKWERVVKYAIITNKLSIEGGELTPSMKLRRNEIEKKYSKIIDNMYK